MVLDTKKRFNFITSLNYAAVSLVNTSVVQIYIFSYRII